ncbi:MAG: hypothetical protein KDE31_16230, partial [Caldilineaceae bacterium]|nr:hypothetical protein [Caldilineaceae bacterium]
EEALARAERVATARARDPVPPSPEQLGEYAAAHALVASFRQDHATTIRSARQALDRLPPSAAQLRITVSSGLGYGYYCAGDLRRAESTLRNALQLSRPEYVVTHVTLLGMLAMAIELQGRMAEAVTLYRAILAQAQLEEVTEQQSKPRYLPNPSVLLALHGLALRLYEFNQLDEATALLAQAVTLSTAAGNQMIQGHALATQALVHQARGDFATADELLTRAAAILEPLAVSSYSLVNAQQIFLWCTMGKVDAALAWADQFTATHPARPQPITAFETAYFALARVWIHNGQFAQASALLTDLEAQANAGNYHYYVLWAKLLQAVRFAAVGETPRAEEALLIALQWAAPAGYIRSFVDEGAVVQTLLTTIRTKQAKSDPTLLAYVDRLLAVFPTGAAEPPAQSNTVTRQTAPPAPLIEPLTEREIEVLQLVARGLSNRAMAQELTVALSTVKKHLVHIYGKLGVSSRTQALIRADELGLLP